MAKTTTRQKRAPTQSARTENARERMRRELRRSARLEKEITRLVRQVERLRAKADSVLLEFASNVVADAADDRLTREAGQAGQP